MLLTVFSCLLRNRRNRETSILKAIENGGKTLFDIVSEVYCEVDRSFWIPAASNVRLHVDHLAQENKLTEVIFTVLSNIFLFDRKHVRFHVLHDHVDDFTL